MSTWKKASKVNQKTHRERHQPASRANLGILEKKKDYKFRADEYNKKKNIIKKLRNIALNKNEDEFHFHMVNSKMIDGRHVEKPPPVTEDTIEQKKLMENKNLKYVNMKKTIETKKIERLQSQLHLIDVANQVQSNHIRFDEEGNSSSEHPALRNRRVNKPTVDELARMKIPEIDRKSLKKGYKERDLKYKELAKRIQREKQLAIVARKMEIDTALSKTKKDSKPKLVQRGSKTSAPVFVWKYERKR